MAGNDTAALVVALSAQITAFEKAMDKAFEKADRTTKGIENRFEKMNGVVSNKFEELKNVALGAAGTAGQLLGSLGPAGIVAAVGIGGLIVALNKAQEMAHELAQKAKEIRDLSDATGLTTREFQALSSAAGRVGVTSEEIGGFITKLTVNLDELRRGGGTLADQLRRIPNIGPKLLDELAAAKSTSEAITILGKAYANLDTVQRNALSRAIGGRGGAGALSRLLPGLDVAAITKSFDDAGKGLDDNLIRKLAQLETDIQRTSGAIKRNIASIFAEDVLSGQLRYLTQLEEISKVAKEFGLSAGLLKLINSDVGGAMLRALPPQIGGPIRAGGQIIEAVSGALNAPEDVERLIDEQKRLSDNLDNTLKQVEKFRNLSRAPGDNSAILMEVWQKRSQEAAASLEKVNKQVDALRSKDAAPGRPPEVAAPAQKITLTEPGPQFKFEEFKKLIAVLGEAATPAERLKLKVLELAAASADNQKITNEAARALAAYNLAEAAGLLAIRERLGVATQADIERVKQAQLDDLVAKKIITNSGDIATAQRVIQLEAKRTAEALQVRASSLPQLTRFGQEAADLNKQFDQLAVGGFRSFEDAIADIGTSTKSASQAFADMSKSILRDLIKIAVRMSITGPLVRSLFGAFGLGGGGTPTGPGFPIGGNAAGTDNWRGGPTWVGEKGPEIVNLPRGAQVIPNDVIRSGSRSSTHDVAGGGNVSVLPPVVNVHNYTGEKTNSKVNSDGSVDVFVGMMDNALAEKSLRGQSAFGKMHAAQADGRSLRGA